MYRGALLKWLLMGTTVLALLSCTKKSDDAEAVRRLIDRGAKLAERHRIGDLMDLTADGFTALPGDYNAGIVSRILFRAFQYYGRFSIRYPQPMVTSSESPPRAEATVYFMIVSKDHSVPGLKELVDDPRSWLEAAGETADLYQLRLDLLKTDGDWRASRARLEPFKGWGF